MHLCLFIYELVFADYKIQKEGVFFVMPPFVLGDSPHVVVLSEGGRLHGCDPVRVVAEEARHGGLPDLI